MKTFETTHLVGARWARIAAVVLPLALLLALFGVPHTVQAAVGTGEATGSVALEFEKTAVADTVWVGTVTGDFEGVLTTVLIGADTSEPVWSVDFYWIVTATDPERSFVARLSGTLDGETGEVAMSGRVVEGYRAGAPVEERGQLFDAERSAFRGSIAIQARSED